MTATLFYAKISENFHCRQLGNQDQCKAHSVSPEVSRFSSEMQSLRLSSSNWFSLSESNSVEVSEEQELEPDSAMVGVFCRNRTGDFLRAGLFFFLFFAGLPLFFLAPDTRSRLISSVFLPALVDPSSGSRSSCPLNFFFEIVRFSQISLIKE